MKPKYDPVDDSEKKLQSYENLEEGLRRSETYANPSDTCDICGKSFANRRFMIDGSLKEQRLMWACMCSCCFLTQGEGIGWGKGQLYTQLDNDEWLMTAGFPLDE
jgi:hypothetical protein